MFIISPRNIQNSSFSGVILSYNNPWWKSENDILSIMLLSFSSLACYHVLVINVVYSCSSTFILLLFSFVCNLSYAVVFCFHSIIYNIQVRYKQTIDISLSRFYFEMINPTNFLKVFADRTSNLLSSTFSNTSTVTNTMTKKCYW